MKQKSILVLATSVFFVVAQLASESVLADLYAIDNNGYVFNAVTGDLFSMSGPSWATGLAYNSNDSFLYAIDNNGYVLNAETGELFSTSGPSWTTGLAYNSNDGYLYAIDNNGYVFNAETGALFSMSGPSWTTGLAYVPVPSAVILGSLGIGFSGWLLRKRRMV